MKFIFAYHGGGMPESKEEQDAAMAAWGAWMGGLGDALVDGGNPIVASGTVSPDGSTADGGGTNPLSGYSLVEAPDMAGALEIAKGCPILAAGGTVEVGQTVDM